MDVLVLADVKGAPIAEHFCGSSALLDVVIAIKAKHTADANLCKK
jgi:hypothetical protein